MGLLLLLVYPATEFILWLMMAEIWDWTGNVLEILISGVVGFFYIKKAGFGTLMRVQEAALQGKSPAAQVIKAFCFFLGGFLLMVPGVLSDVVGLVLVLPLSRHLVSSMMAKSWASSQRVWVRVGNFGNFGGFYSTHTSRPMDHEDVIEVEAVEIQKRISSTENSKDA